eukprot:TRINITY_DN3275_c0_g1_i1.p1 TRINITY_DN3275_c0_g1~~TRINITY_DN3275_c0_g1_i1.p1  ORF type:complete len:874 (-),score=103.78 TRINITY_DN3275_c0_g1_i1:458-3079(-)
MEESQERECFNDVWSKSLESESYLPGARGPHMGMGVKPPDAPRRTGKPGVFGESVCAIHDGKRFLDSTPQKPDRQSLCGVPQDVMIRLILQHFGPRQLTLAGLVCQEWRCLSEASSLWRNLFLNVKFWRIWYNDPTDWKSEFLRRHTQELSIEDSPPSTPMVMSDDNSDSEDVPFWHRRWHGDGNGATEGVPIVVVSCAHAVGDSPELDEEGAEITRFSTIQSAVDAVEEGTRIIVEPGVYSENLLRIDKELELVGRGGEGQRVIVKANVEICGVLTRLANLNIETQPTDTDEGSVRISEGSQASVEDCDIQGSLILNGNRGVIRNNRIHNGLQNGVLIQGGQGTITNNDVTGHKMCGIILKGDANPVVRNNTFSGNNLAGIVIGDAAGGTFESNRTVQNSHYGVAVGASAMPMLRGNFCQENGMGGMLASGNSTGKFENNEISKNTGHGMVLAGTNRAVVTGNTLKHNGESGMALCGDSRPSIEDNHVSKNNGPGVIIQDASEPIVRRNKLKTNQREGIVVLDNGGGTIEHNHVSNNKCAGVVLNENATSTLRSNTVSKNQGAGIVVRDHAQSEIVQNKVSENEMAGVSIHDQAQIKLTENLVSHNQSTGVAMADQTVCAVEKNHIIGNSMSGIETFGDSSQTFRENRVSRNAQAGCVIGSTSDNVVMDGNRFKNNTMSEVVIQNKANPPTFKNNTYCPHIARPGTTADPFNVEDGGAPGEEVPIVCKDEDLIGPAGIGRGQVIPIHLASTASKLYLFATNSSDTDVTITFELWKNNHKQQFNLQSPASTVDKLLIPGAPVDCPDDVWCYVPMQGVARDFDPECVILYGFCVVNDQKIRLTPSQVRVAKERVGSTQARYERNTGCDLESMSE